MNSTELARQDTGNPRDGRSDRYDQQDYVRDAGAKHGFAYTVLRPHLVTGKTPGALNVLPAIGVDAAIRRQKGEPFSFPGGPSFVWERTDADLVAPQAANENFKVTNGDVCDGGDAGSRWPDEPTSLATYNS